MERALQSSCSSEDEVALARTVVSARALEGAIAHVGIELSSGNGSGVTKYISINDLAMNGIA